MDLMRIPLFEALAKRMTWLGDRQNMLAENVANADTPGYLARDLRPPDFRSMLAKQADRKVTLTTTQPGHIAVQSTTSSATQVETNGDRSLNGNGVSLEEQMMKVSQTANDFALTTSLYRANLGLIKSVLGRSSS
jgi:flagellar basal-body rod protein FlgB